MPTTLAIHINIPLANLLMGFDPFAAHPPSDGIIFHTLIQNLAAHFPWAIEAAGHNPNPDAL